MLESSAFVPLWNTLSLLSTLQLYSHSQLVTGREQAIFTKRDKFGKVLGLATCPDCRCTTGWARLWLCCQEFSSSYLNVCNPWPQSGSGVCPKPPPPWLHPWSVQLSLLQYNQCDCHIEALSWLPHVKSCHNTHVVILSTRLQHARAHHPRANSARAHCACAALFNTQ